MIRSHHVTFGLSFIARLIAAFLTGVLMTLGWFLGRNHPAIYVLIPAAIAFWLAALASTRQVKVRGILYLPVMIVATVFTMAVLFILSWEPMD